MLRVLTLIFSLLVRFAALVLALLEFIPAFCQFDTLYNERYTVIYSGYYRVPMQVSWKLYAADVVGVVKRGKWSFRTDHRVDKPRATSSDYNRSGYQRSHMCPAADWVSDVSHMKDTFIMTNIVPQTSSLNNGTWKRDEAATRLAAVRFDSVLVMCGVIFDPKPPKRIGRHGVAVPDRFWKRVIILKNDSVFLNRYYVNM